MVEGHKSSFIPRKQEEGGGQVLTMLKWGHKKCSGSFNAGSLSFRHPDGVGTQIVSTLLNRRHKMFYPISRQSG